MIQLNWFVLIFICFSVLPGKVYGQEQTNSADQFHDLYFDALQYKSIENYDKALAALYKCKAINSKDYSVDYELARNYFFQKKYIEAIDSYNDALELDAKNHWIYKGKYDAYIALNNYFEAIEVIQHLILFDSKYRESLVALYIQTQQFDKAEELILLLDQQVGPSEKRNYFKQQLPQKENAPKQLTAADLKKKISKFPNLESNYNDLIAIYIVQMKYQEAFETIKRVNDQIHESKWNSVVNYTSQLHQLNYDQAIESLGKLLQSATFDILEKKMLMYQLISSQDFIQVYDKDLSSQLKKLNLSDERNQLFENIINYYTNQVNNSRAITYTKGLSEINPNDLKVYLLLLDLYALERNYKELNLECENLIDLFPLQPQLYYFYGSANNSLNNFQKGRSILEEGLDFIVEDVELEIKFRLQLIESCNGLNDSIKAGYHQEKINRLKELKK